jgi:FAD/FMN-containing dehydrogenase
MSHSVANRVRETLGLDRIDRDPAGRPRIAPDSTAAAARAFELASSEGWTVRIEGRGTWMPPDTPADLVVSTAALDATDRISPEDLVATVGAGIAFDVLSHQLRSQGMWLPWDPPGRPDRSVGSIVATGTAGSLRHGAGPVKDQLLGCTLVTGDGRVVRPGGVVVKNVAGYDLTRLQAGAFGGFGLLTELHLRLMAGPPCDRTLVARGERDTLTSAARDLMEARLECAALELISPALAALPDWVLALRLTGPETGVAAQSERARSLTDLGWNALSEEQSAALWTSASRGILGGAVTIRLGTLLDGLDHVLDLLGERLDTGLVVAGAGSGSIRWSGEAPLDALRAVRRIAAGREVPVTLERGPWPVRHAFGHFGAYREGVGALVARLQDAFDPRHVLPLPLEEAADG